MVIVFLSFLELKLIKMTEVHKSVLGPPGTGKTTYLAERISKAKERGDSIMVASLTRAAAYEIGERADLEKGELVGTLHSICLAALGHPKLIYRKLDEFNSLYGYSIGAFDEESDDLGYKGDVFSSFMMHRAINGTPESLDDYPSHLVDFATRMDAWKKSFNGYDFLDLIEECIKQHRFHPLEPDIILYDEAQDGSPAELKLVHQWGEHCRAAVIAGDDDQTLYEWRGASARDFLEWSDKKYVLSQSWRLPRKVWEYSLEWVRQIKYRYDKRFDSRDEEGYVRRVTSCLRIPDQVIDECIKHTKNNETSMILATCGYQLKSIVEQLRERGVPFWNPHRIKNGDWNPLRRSDKANTAYRKIVSFLKYSKTNIPWTWRELYSWAGKLTKEEINHGMKIKMERRKTSDTIASFEDISDILKPAVLDIAFSGDLTGYVNMLSESERARMLYPVSVMTGFGAEHIKRPKIIVGTIHSVKGGEADHVYLFPDLSRAAQSERTFNEDPLFRTFYVGITRAKVGVNLCSPNPGVASSFVRWI